MEPPDPSPSDPEGSEKSVRSIVAPRFTTAMPEGPKSVAHALARQEGPALAFLLEKGRTPSRSISRKWIARGRRVPMTLVVARAVGAALLLASLRRDHFRSATSGKTQ